MLSTVGQEASDCYSTYYASGPGSLVIATVPSDILVTSGQEASDCYSTYYTAGSRKLVIATPHIIPSGQMLVLLLHILYRRGPGASDCYSTYIPSGPGSSELLLHIYTVGSRKLVIAIHIYTSDQGASGLLYGREQEGSSDCYSTYYTVREQEASDCYYHILYPTRKLVMHPHIIPSDQEVVIATVNIIPSGPGAELVTATPHYTVGPGSSDCYSTYLYRHQELVLRSIYLPSGQEASDCTPILYRRDQGASDCYSTYYTVGTRKYATPHINRRTRKLVTATPQYIYRRDQEASDCYSNIIPSGPEASDCYSTYIYRRDQEASDCYSTYYTVGSRKVVTATPHIIPSGPGS
ncbi:Hypothetical predicted protein [Mytilus galloprovincialis]|uniref:Uncharacterized protein n=1 Tax=Mytilus galloprovincialis TaxID=29158 RepID=A0A8B6GEC0_MYTGA|nr:Hypothetical predicted protein [Mytilus galloprovincialis]